MNKQKGLSGRGRGPGFKGKSILANSKLRIIENSFLEEALSPFGVVLSSPLADALRRYLELLLRWNRKINLTATSDLGELLRRHGPLAVFQNRTVSVAVKVWPPAVFKVTANEPDPLVSVLLLNPVTSGSVVVNFTEPV